MATFSDFKKEMLFLDDFATLMEILKSLAIMQYYELAKKIKGFDRFKKTLKSFFQVFNSQNILHPLDSGKGPLTVIAITSEKGFVGGTNHKVINVSLNYVKEAGGKIIVIGKQGQWLVKEKDVEYECFPGIESARKLEQALALRDHIFREVSAGRMGSVKVVYPQASSLLVQTTETQTLIPISEWTNEEKTPVSYPELIQESNSDAIFDYLVFLYLGKKLADIFDASLLAEYASRYVHLEESTEKIKEENNKLKFQYFRARHEIIDQQMRELFSAQSLIQGIDA